MGYISCAAEFRSLSEFLGSPGHGRVYRLKPPPTSHRSYFCVRKIIAFFIITLPARLDVRVGILLSYGKHLHDCIISLRRERNSALSAQVIVNPTTIRSRPRCPLRRQAWPHITSLIPSLFIEVQKRRVSGHILVCQGYLSMIFLLDFWCYILLTIHFCDILLTQIIDLLLTQRKKGK